MSQLISDPSKLQLYQKRFIDELDSVQTSTVHCRISWRPKYEEADVRWSSKLNLWWYSKPLDNRWWNAFGIDHPKPYQALQINCEINIPTKEINRSIAGAFAEDEDNRVFVVHRGNKWGGGKAGITKALFWNNYAGRSELAHDGELVTKVAVIAELGNPKLPSYIANFVDWVARVKASV